ncbi:HAD family hydrolase [Gluconacetobacter entanii]|uniref:HAD hydrolase family protein n=1 Tax=Gluconacetobacter entanii TaxID=108528 RepID=UPI001C936402|nr:HAD hydrolase family protein [Gluconacetobacter entanii]MBY4640942.1 HAD family hydrolase [Gluconacetobacter entanii]MCW4579047.1 HAD family hydrolase [Gluconacetobacter entanii]MCW4582447.1 HAD family hydrolase [Gluconacetobacter entanii]MCW4585822.1 HAD family hydrolase [Gluconacetobacter entanii]
MTKPYVLFDIDGTICFDGKMIDPRLENAIEGLSELFEIVFATARHPFDMLDLFKLFDVYKLNIIGCNGAIYYKGGNVKRVFHFAPSVGAEIYRRVAGYGGTTVGLGENSLFFERSEAYLVAQQEWKFSHRYSVSFTIEEGRLCKIMTKGQDITNLINADCMLPDVCTIYTHRDGSIDLVKKGTNKLTPIHHSLGNSMIYAAFGNDENDRAMLLNASRRIVVGDGIQGIPNAEIVASGEEVVPNLLKKIRSLIE